MAVVNKEIDKDGGSVEVGYSFNSTGCEGTIVSGRSNVTWLTVVANTTTSKLVISAPANDGNERSGVVYVTVNGTDCPNNKIQVTQGDGAEPKITCVRGTDNGDDIIDDKVYSYPLFVCGEACNDGDSIVVGSLKYNGSDLPTSSDNAVSVCDWFKMWRTTQGGVCGTGMIQYIIAENNTGAPRETAFTLTTDDTETLVVTLPGHPQYGQQYSVQGLTNTCPSWTVTIKQCRPGYYWCISDNQRIGVETPCGTSCGDGYTNHACKEGCGGGSTCECGSISTVDTIYFNYDAVGRNYSKKIEAIDPCVTKVELTPGHSYSTFTVTSFTENVIEVFPYTANTGNVERKETIYVTYTISTDSGDKTCQKETYVTQQAQGNPGCQSCDDLKPAEAEQLPKMSETASFYSYDTNTRTYTTDSYTVDVYGPIEFESSGGDRQVEVNPRKFCNIWCSRPNWSVTVDNVWEDCTNPHGSGDGGDCRGCIGIHIGESNSQRSGYYVLEWQNSNGIAIPCYAIKVVQNGGQSECTCESAAIGNVSPVTNLQPGIGQGTLIATFTATTKCSKNDYSVVKVGGADIASRISVSMSTDYNVILAEISPNPTTSPRSEELAIYLDGQSCTSFTITQKAGGCMCDTITIPSVAFEYSDTEADTIEVTPNSCIASVIDYDDTEHFLVTATTTTVSIQPRETNTSTTAYVDTVTINYKLSDNSTCTKTFTATQYSEEQDCNCTTAAIRLSTVSQFSANAATNQPIATMTSSDACNANSFGVERYSGGTFVTYRSIGITSTNYTIIGDISENTDTKDREEMMVVTVNGQRCGGWFTVKQAGKSSTQCTCGTVSGRLNIGATATGGVLLGSFNGSNDCSASDYKVVKYSEETIVNIANTTISKSGSIYRIYANVTNTNTSTSPRTQTLLVQKVSDGQMCGGPFVIEQQGTTPLCVVDLIVSRDSTVDCGVHFKIKEMCSSIGTYDVIEWGCSTNNTPVFDQSAFGAIVASGDGITQNASVDSTTFTNYHIWWRNRQAPAVSGTTVIQLKKCEHTPTKFNATVRIDQVEDSSMSPNSIDWGDGYITTPLEKGAEYIHMYNDDTQDYTCTVFGNRIYTMNKDNHHVTICDCVALQEIDPYVFFGNTSSSKSISVNPNGCSSMYWVKEASQTWCTAQFEENDTKLKLTASSNSSGNIRSAAFLVGIRIGSSTQDTCQWIYAKQGDTATCNTVYTEMNGKTVYFEFNAPNTQTILTNCKYANMKDINTGSTSDIVYEDFDGDKWSWEEYERYGRNWITGCTWLTTGGLQINVTGNYSNTTRSATLNIRLLDDADNTICARIYVSQYCEHCTSAGSRDAGSNDEG